MKKVLLTASLFTVLSLTSMLAANAANNNTATATATASANILRGITIAKTQDLKFGQIVPNGGGVITVSPAGSRTLFSGDATLIDESYSPISAAAFTVNGDGGHNYDIDLPDNIQIKNGDAEMTVDNFKCSIATNVGTLSGALNAAGSETFTVGADLHVDAAQAYGAYSGTFPVTVTYQ